MKKLTTEEFISRAKEVHGDKYSYEKVEYVNSTTKVIIICKKHGEFYQTPAAHIHSNAGCPTCNKVTKEEFIERARIVHGEKYDYSEIVYVDAKTAISLTCPFCGKIFEQTPSHHMEGKNCPLCRRERAGRSLRKDTDYFVAQANKKHVEGKYDYSLVEYKGNKIPVKIICRKHGVFEQTPSDHLQGYGCKLCANETISKKKLFSLKEFVKKAKAVHGDTYDYSQVEYTYSNDKVSIICKKHGLFHQAPSQHWSGRGCPSCAKYGFDITQPGILYVLSISGNSGDFVGYGVTRDYKTRLTTHKRFLMLSGYSVIDDWTSCEVQGTTLREVEKRVAEEFTTSKLSERIEGFRTESTDSSFVSVVEFIQQQLRKEVACG